MQKQGLIAHFVNLHFVEADYHKMHSQLIHRHEDVLELFYVMRGSGQYMVGGREYPVQPGSMILCSAGVFHGEKPFCAQGMESYCCVVDSVQLPKLPPNTLSMPSQNPVLYFTENRQTVERLLLSLRDLNSQSPVPAEICDLLASALTLLACEKLRLRQRTNDLTQRNTEEFIQSVTDYLDTHFAEALQLPELAEKFHISPYYLSRLFKAETGLSPMRYVMYRRIGEAQNLLMNTELSIGDIGGEMGFIDSCHFSRMFKKYIGLTPTEYRRYFRGMEK